VQLLQRFDIPLVAEKSIAFVAGGFFDDVEFQGNTLLCMTLK